MRTYVKGTFTLDTLDGLVFNGYSTGEMWNGWEYPYFERDEAENVLRASEANNYYWHYDAEADAFVVRSAEDPEDYEPEVFSGVKVEIDGKEMILYGIGANTWTWRAVSAIR